MGRLHKIKISKIENEVERRITINAVDLSTYIVDGWTADTKPYIDEPVDDKIEAPAEDEIEAPVDETKKVAEEIKVVVDEDLLVD